MRDQDSKAEPALSWLEGYLVKQKTSADDVVRDEHQRQGSTNVTVRNIITSMRLVSQVDWAELFERMSLVDDLLKENHSFAKMDFPTRNLYRAAIEELSKGSKHSEIEVTQIALLAVLNVKESKRKEQDSFVGELDPGYYLISGGRRDFEKRIGFRPSLKIFFGRILSDIGVSGQELRKYPIDQE